MQLDSTREDCCCRFCQYNLGWDVVLTPDGKKKIIKFKLIALAVGLIRKVIRKNAPYCDVIEFWCLTGKRNNKIAPNRYKEMATFKIGEEVREMIEGSDYVKLLEEFDELFKKAHHLISQ